MGGADHEGGEALVEECRHPPGPTAASNDSKRGLGSLSRAEKGARAVDSRAGGAGMADEKKTDPVAGQLVKIVTCAHDLPEHIGQLGVVGARPNRKRRTFTVHVGTGLCQAVEVVLASDDAASVKGRP